MLDLEPVLDEWLERPWAAFAALHRARQCAFGPNPIQVSEIEAWCRMFPQDDPVETYRMVVELDSHYLKWWEKKNAKK